MPGGVTDAYKMLSPMACPMIRMGCGYRARARVHAILYLIEEFSILSDFSFHEWKLYVLLFACVCFSLVSRAITLNVRPHVTPIGAQRSAFIGNILVL